MTPHHTITTRPATEDELEALRVRAHASTRAARTLDTFVLAVTAALPLLLAITLGVAFLRPTPPTVAEIVGRFVAILITAAFALFMRSRLRAGAPPPTNDRTEELDAGVVEVIEVTTDRAVMFHPYDRDGCNTGLAFDVGEGRTLVLFTDLRGDPTVEGDEWTPEHDPPPYLHFSDAVFPTPRFTLTRTPKTGYILKIRTEGSFLRPDVHDLPKINTHPTDDPESRFIDTPLDDLR